MERKGEGIAAAFDDVGGRGESDGAAPDLVAATSFDHRRKKRMPRQRRSALDALFHHHSLASSSSSSHVPPTPLRLLHLLPAPASACIPPARVTFLFSYCVFMPYVFFNITNYILLLYSPHPLPPFY